MDIRTALSHVMHAETNFKSMSTVRHALDKFEFAMVDVAILNKHLINCEYSTNAQLIVLATSHEAYGKREQFDLLFFMNLEVLTEAELTFLIEVYPIIFSYMLDCQPNLEKGDMKFPDNLTKGQVFKLTKINVPIFQELVFQEYGFNRFSIDELITLGLKTITNSLTSKIIINIFTREDFPVYIQKQCIDENSTDFEEFISKIAEVFKYLGDKGNVGHVA